MPRLLAPPTQFRTQNNQKHVAIRKKNPDEAKPSKLNIRLTQAAGFVEGAPACDRNVAAALGFRAADRVSHQALTLVFSIASREVITLSTMPKSLASSAVMKWSRSSVRSIVS